MGRFVYIEYAGERLCIKEWAARLGLAQKTLGARLQHGWTLDAAFTTLPGTRVGGRFVRRLAPWTPERWDEGWVDSRGYFRVYRPDYPRAWPSGYAKRYHVVYWLLTGRVLAENEVLHHRNGIKTDDRLENIEVLDRGEHTKLHHPSTLLFIICATCGVAFRDPKKPHRKYCTFACYHKAPKQAETLAKQAEGMKRAHREGRADSYRLGRWKQAHANV